MKKIIISLVMVFTVAASAFAGDKHIDEKISKAFEKEFSTAQNAVWSVVGNVYKVTFSYFDRSIIAYYDKKGNLMGVVKYMLPTELPYYLQKQLKEYYKSFWVTNLFELSNENGTSYYVTLQNSEDKIVLSSSGQNSWEGFSDFSND